MNISGRARSKDMVGRNMKLLLAVVIFGALSLGASTVGFTAPLTIPSSQAPCTFDSASITAADGVQPIPNLQATVRNWSSTTPRQAIVQLSADVNVDAGAEVKVSYSIDSEEPAIFGPNNLA